MGRVDVGKDREHYSDGQNFRNGKDGIAWLLGNKGPKKLMGV